MARHANQRAFTVNTQRVNENPQPRVEKKTQALDALELEECCSFDAPTRLGTNFHLMLTGQSRAGGVF